MKYLLLILMAFSAGLQAAQSGKPQSAKILALDDDANGCFTDQGGSAALDLNGALASGGTCRFLSAQQISIEGSGNNSGITFAIVGKGADNKAESETLTGSNAGTAKSVRYYQSITSITPSAVITGNVEGGPLSTNGAVSVSLVPDLSGYSPVMSLVADFNGTMTATIEHTTDLTPSPVDQLWFNTSGMAAKTTDTIGNIVAPVAAVRIKITAYTSGDIELRMLQARK